MSRLKIYGVSHSRAQRTLWMANELGLDYENIPVNFMGGETRTEEFLAINPNGRIPAIDDDGFVLWESMAINLYLARKHGKLWPDSLKGEALAYQWSFWVMTEVEKPIIYVLFNRALFPEGKRDADFAAAQEEKVHPPFKVLDAALAKSPYLAGDTFTVADLNVASIIALCPPAKIDLTAYPNIADWLGRCAARPAAPKNL